MYRVLGTVYILCRLPAVLFRGAPSHHLDHIQEENQKVFSETSLCSRRKV